MKFLVKFDVEFDLKLGISDGKNLMKFVRGLFYLPGKHRTFQGEFRGRFRGKYRRSFRKFCFKFRVVFGNFVQQNDDANELDH